MSKTHTMILSLLLSVILLFGMSVKVSAAVSKEALAAAIEDTAAYIHKVIKAPQVGSVGGEWAILSLARSGYDVPEEYYQDYYSILEAYVKACNGNMHDKKYTEYSRVIVALSSIGKDAYDVAGYNLVKPLGDFDKTVWQGINGPIWALIALDSGDYPMPENREAVTQATRQMYIDKILEYQLSDGGWSQFDGTTSASAGVRVSDPDITGMALQALAKYQDQPAVMNATQEALMCMSKQQKSDGGFYSWGSLNSESCVQIIVALCELGISLDDPKFVKNGKTLLDNLMMFYRKGEGFLHTQDGDGSNLMATEQGLYGMVAAQRRMNEKNSLYRMGDAISVAVGQGKQAGIGLEGKNQYIKSCPIVQFERTFDDISGENAHKNQQAIEALASREIINGKENGLFDPNASMTRAEFAAIIVRGLGLTEKEVDQFNDVPSGRWYSGFIGTAFTYGIVNGKSEKNFDPNGTITRQEAAAMLTRAAKLCGLDTELDSGAIRDVLAQFADYVSAAEWGRPYLAFCYGDGILDQSELEIKPNLAIKRCEIAQALFNLLAISNLL